MAAYKGHASVTKELIDSSRCNLDSQTISGCTPLLIATQEKHSSITEQLIVARCNVDLAKKDGFTPLHMAVYDGVTVISKQLLAARCNVDLQTTNGFTPLHLAAECGHVILAKQLLAARCNVDLQNKRGERAVVLARITGHAGIAKLILSHKQKDAAGAIKDILPEAEAGPEKTKNQQEEDADGPINELLGKEVKGAGSVANTNKTGEERRRNGHGQDESKKEEKAEKHEALAHPATSECALCVYSEESADLRARGVDSMGFFRGKDGSVRSITEELADWEEEQKSAFTISHKTEQAANSANTRNTRNDRRLNAADAQAVSKEEEHREEVKVQHLCPHTTIYVSSCYHSCVLILLHMCPHTTIYVSSYYYMCEGY